MWGLLVGCCGWAGSRSKYFPDFPVVELQTTFYQPPSVALAEKWRAEAPADFVFTLKAWQLITHPASSPTYRRLRQPVALDQRDRYGFFRPTDEVWRAWLATRAIARALRAAVIVFQCPASFLPSPENCDHLAQFFSRIEREGWLVAWEPRGSWPPGQVQHLCRDLDLIHCVDPLFAAPTHGRPAYFRLHGRGGYNYRYTDADLAELARVSERHPEIYVLFNNVHMRDDARRFLDTIGRHDP
jgi:uncharacterized protein YecE (DUF72 family)